MEKEKAERLCKLFERVERDEKAAALLGIVAMHLEAETLIKGKGEGCPIKPLAISTEIVLSSTLSMCASISDDVKRLTEISATQTTRIARLEGAENGK